AGGTLDLDLSSMCFDQRLCDKKSQAHAASGVIRLPVLFKNMGQCFRRNTGSVIGHSKLNMLIHMLYTEFNTSVFRREFHGISKEIRKNFNDPGGIGFWTMCEIRTR